MRRPPLVPTLEVLGILVAVVGVWQFSTALALVVGGLLTVFLAQGLDRRGSTGSTDEEP